MSLTEHFIAATWEQITGTFFSPGSKADDFSRAIESAATAPLLEQIKELEAERDQWKDDAMNGSNAEFLRQKIAELEQKLEDCAKYLKEGETPAQRIQREIDDNHAVLGLLAAARAELEVARKIVNAARDCANDSREHDGEDFIVSCELMAVLSVNLDEFDSAISKEKT